MDDNANQLAFTMFNKKLGYALLVGSGISRTSGMPTGWEILLNLLKQMQIMEDPNDKDDPEKWYKKKFQKEADYSDVLNLLADTDSMRRSALYPHFQKDANGKYYTPSAAHYAIADLVQKGYIKIILTTNFDDLIEQALKERTIKYQIIHQQNIEGADSIMSDICSVVKINGDYTSHCLRNTKDELSNLDSKIVHLIQNIINEHGLIVTGWSSDWDIHLSQIIKDNYTMKNSLYWTFKGQLNQKSNSICNLLAAKTIKISDGIDFFSRLVKTINNLESMKQTILLTPELTGRMAEKYISEKDEIGYYNFISDETYGLITKMNELNLKGDVLFTVFKDKVTIIEEVASNLLMAISNGVYWSKKLDFQLLKNTILRLEQSSKALDNNIYRYSYTQLRLIESDLQHYPTLMIVYIVGILLVIKKDFINLKKLFEIEISFEKGKLPLFKYIEVNSILKTYDWNFALDLFVNFNINSKHLSSIISTYFVSWYPDKDDFLYFYDYFEFLYALYVKYKLDEIFICRFVNKGYRYHNYDYNATIYGVFKKDAEISSSEFNSIVTDIFNSDTKGYLRAIEEYKIRVLDNNP